MGDRLLAVAQKHLPNWLALVIEPKTKACGLPWLLNFEPPPSGASHAARVPGCHLPSRHERKPQERENVASASKYSDYLQFRQWQAGRVSGKTSIWLRVCLFCPGGFKGNLPLLEICVCSLFFQGT